MAVGLGAISGLLILAFVYWFFLRPRYRHWGTTTEEVKRGMPGDSGVPVPTYETTLAVTVNAPPDGIWPWLLQLGYRRGGLYSYDT